MDRGIPSKEKLSLLFGEGHQSSALCSRASEFGCIAFALNHGVHQTSQSVTNFMRGVVLLYSVPQFCTSLFIICAWEFLHEELNFFQ
jgi:hypothetical protein